MGIITDFDFDKMRQRKFAVGGIRHAGKPVICQFN